MSCGLLAVVDVEELRGVWTNPRHLGKMGWFVTGAAF